MGLSGDINAEKGNCATFLLKMDGILDSLIHDMISSEKPEAKVSFSFHDYLLTISYTWHVWAVLYL